MKYYVVVRNDRIPEATWSFLGANVGYRCILAVGEESEREDLFSKGAVWRRRDNVWGMNICRDNPGTI